MSNPSENTGAFSKLSPGAPDDPVAFGKYYLLGLIARGGMAEVYRAARTPATGDERLLAVKVHAAAARARGALHRHVPSARASSR